MRNFKNSVRNAFAFSAMLFAAAAISSCEVDKNKDFVETAYDLNMKMIYVQGGQFYMGGTDEQARYAQEDEIVRQVTLDGYYIAQYEVTQSQWKKVMGTTLADQRDLSGSDAELNGVGADYAMYYVSWDEAKEFVKKLRDRTGKNYVLPTEAQWEYAARGGANIADAARTVCAGSDDASAVAYFADNSNMSVHGVGEKQPNALGLYDMSGNVYEWCEDYYGEYKHFFGENNATESHNPKGPKTGFDRVLRGGCYFDGAGACRISARSYDEPFENKKMYGFRVALIPSNAENSVDNVYAADYDGEIVYDKSFERVLGVGKTVDFSVDFSDGKNHKVYWISEYPEIADVDQSGKVLGMTPGATRIAAFDSNDNIIDLISIFVDEAQNIKDQETALASEIVNNVGSMVDEVIRQVENASAPAPKNEINPYATTSFSGKLKNGHPSGTGTLTFKSSRRIDMHDEKNRFAAAGDYIIGEWDNGHLIQGRWYDKSNNLKETIILGKASNPELDFELGTSSK